MNVCQVLCTSQCTGHTQCSLSRLCDAPTDTHFPALGGMGSYVKFEVRECENFVLVALIVGLLFCCWFTFLVAVERRPFVHA